jgi:hypothetical protein
VYPGEPTLAGTPRPTPTATLEPDPTVAAAVVLRDSAFEFIGLDGERLERREARGMQDLQPHTAQVLGASVFYLDAEDHVVKRATSDGTLTLGVTSDPGLSSFLISGDRTRLAWVVSRFSDAISSELWVAGINGEDPIQVARTDPGRPEQTAHLMEPYRWTEDGDLIFTWQPIGLGGYTLYGGYASFYRFSPLAKRTTPILPLTPLSPGPCWSDMSLDLTLAVGTCGGQGEPAGLRILTLGTGSELIVPPVENQGTAGAAAISPDGRRVAYAVARNSPEAESGQVLLLDLAPGSQPIALATLPNGYARRLAWLDDDRLVVGERTGDTDRVVLLTLGGGEVVLGEGLLVGLQIP